MPDDWTPFWQRLLIEYRKPLPKPPPEPKPKPEQQ